ncbi:MAG TPA: histidine kinase dimerization/phosphoacceptor domain -containing protein [Allosphingosinicella sp.]|nr:histidine kinase dimerization/phosphoacceptor domain -containing protein [Allosphingosinicella sp.]
MQQFDNLADAQTLALAIVDTFPEPFLVLDEGLRVLAASRCFYEIFGEDPVTAHGRLFFDLGAGPWDVPALRLGLEAVLRDHVPMNGFELEQDYPDLGRRTMLLGARLVRYDESSRPTLLLAFKDITERRLIEQEKQALLEHTEDLLAQQQTLLREMEHRIANSLQIIASILLLKAGAVASEETREELRDAHQRVMSVAAVQSHLHASDGIEHIDIGAYLTKLSAGLAASMIGPHQGIAIDVEADEGTLQSSHAVSLGLIVTELIINAVKYAFPTARPDARIRITFEMDGADWKLTISDNGCGRSAAAATRSSGLGTVIVGALAKQLRARIDEVSGPGGLRVEVTRATFSPRLPIAA